MSEQPAVSTDLPISQFMPRPALVTPAHHVARPRLSAIDIHNHLGRRLTKDQQWGVSDVPTLLGMMEYCNLSAIVNLDGMWGDELEANLDRYDRAYPGRFFTFAQSDWSLVTEADFGRSMAHQLADSVRRGARGLKVWKTLGLHHRDGAGKLISIDDPRLFDLWEAAGESSVPVLIHIADPVAFFQPLNHTNEAGRSYMPIPTGISRARSSLRSRR
jgi:hypothetical protein